MIKLHTEGKRYNPKTKKEERYEAFYDFDEENKLIKNVINTTWLPYEEIPILGPGERQLLLGIRNPDERNAAVVKYFMAISNGVEPLTIQKAKTKGNVTVTLITGETVSFVDYLIYKQKEMDNAKT
jgi:hypothetical protein